MKINFQMTRDGWFSLLDFLRNGQEILISLWDISPHDPYGNPASWWIRNIAGNAMHGEEMYYLFTFETNKQTAIEWFRQIINDMHGIIEEGEE